LFRKITSGIKWLVIVLTVLFLFEELIRVLTYVIDQWGILHAFIDGAVLYKIGEFIILVPFLLLVHFNGLGKSESLEKYINKVRWLFWTGGLLNFLAAFDLFGRVDWAWWTILLIILSLSAPFMLKRWITKKVKWSSYIVSTLLFILFLLYYGISFLSSGYFIAPLPASHPSPADTESGRWQQDLRYLETELPRLHLNAFHTVSQQDFEKEATRLDSLIPHLKTYEIKAGFEKLVAMIGDGHTQFDWFGSSVSNRYPLRLYWFSDGLFVAATDSSIAQLLEAHLLGIGSMATDQAFKEVCQLIPNESNGFLLQKSQQLLTDANKLFYLGIIDSIGGAVFTFETKTGDTIVYPLSSDPKYNNSSSFCRTDKIPLYKSNPDSEFWSKYFKELNTLYLKYNTFMNPVSFPKFSNEFWKMVDDSLVEFVIVDFRSNSGGASFAFDSFFQSILNHPDINRKNNLFVLVDRVTFSSATLYAVILRRDTKALLVGEDMGGGVNHYGDVRTFKLPNSGIRISYCVQYFESWPDSLPPFDIDIKIMPSSDELFEGEDPVLDSVFQLIEMNQQ